MSKVIINDVDVSECRYLYNRYPEGQIVKCCSLYDNDNSEFNDETVHFCSSHRNCYHKQLVKKTDECKQKDVRFSYLVTSIIKIIKDLEDEDIVTLPDLSPQENYKAIMKQCNRGYVDILNILNKLRYTND